MAGACGVAPAPAVWWWCLLALLAGLASPAPLATRSPSEDWRGGHLKPTAGSDVEVTAALTGLVSSPLTLFYTPTPRELYETTPRGLYEATSPTPRGLYEATSATPRELYEASPAKLQGLYEIPLPTLRSVYEIPRATPRGIYEAPGASRAREAGGDGGGKSGGASDEQAPVTANSEIDAVPRVVAAARYARSKRKTRELLHPPFDSFSQRVEDANRRGAHDTGRGDYIPFHFSSKWNRRSGRGRGHRRRHRVRHGKRRREKENSELPLLDTDFSFGSVLQGANTRKSAHFYTATPPSHTSVGEDQPRLTPMGNTPTTEITLHLNQPSKFTSRIVGGPQKQNSSMPPHESANITQTLPPPQSPQFPRRLGVPVVSYRHYVSQGDFTTQDSVGALITPSTVTVSRRQNPSVDGTPTHQTPTAEDKGLKTLVSDTKLMQRDEVTSAVQREIFPDDLQDAKAHPTPSVDPLSGSLRPSVTQKPQDSKRDPSESNKRQAIKLGSEPSHTSRRNPKTFAQNSEPYAGLKLLIVPATTTRSDEKHGSMLPESLPPSANISVLKLGRDQANESQEYVNNGEVSSGEHSRGKDSEATPTEDVPASQPPPYASQENSPSELRPEQDSVAAAATMAGMTGRNKDGVSGTILQLSGPTYDSESEEANEGVPPSTVFPTPTGKVTQPSSLPEVSGNSLVRPHSSLKGASNSNSPSSSSGCYSTNDVVVVVFLTSLANMVAFVLVTVTLCWCSLRGRLASTPPRPLQHPDDPNTDDLDDEAEEIVAQEGCLEACLPDISYQRHIARGSNLRPSFVVGRALRPLVTPHTPRLSQAVHELLHTLTAPTEDPHAEGGDANPDKGEKMAKKKKKKKPGLFLHRRSLSLENLTLT
ncbi:uncharacterized protein [Procambarus clarkii]|uniref:uncharacterized protein n=1 Tax=Procambarus clarkii TaxID=6728 RepID=UPI0037427D9C